MSLRRRTSLLVAFALVLACVGAFLLREPEGTSCVCRGDSADDTDATVARLRGSPPPAVPGSAPTSELPVGTEARAKPPIEPARPSVPAFPSRDPLVRIFGFVPELGQVAGCVPLDVTPIRSGEPEEGRLEEMQFYRREGLRLPPGDWSFRVRFGQAEVVTTKVHHLEHGDALDIRVPVRFRPGLAVVAVGFDVVGFDAPEVEARCAAEALRMAPEGESYLIRPRASAASVLVVLRPGDYEFMGAIDTAGEVRISAPMRLRLRPGERRRLLLDTRRAGGIRVSAVCRPEWDGATISLLELDSPGHGAVEDRLFDFRWLGDREEPRTWWVPPGRYTLARLSSDEEETDRVSLLVEPGQIAEVIEAEGRLRERGASR